MAMDYEEIALATCNLLQAVYDSLSGGDNRVYGKEEALVLGKTHICYRLYMFSDPIKLLRKYILLLYFILASY